MAAGDLLVVKTESGNDVTEATTAPRSRGFSNTSNLYAGYWIKLLSVNNNTNWSDNIVVLLITIKGSGTLNHTAGFLTLRSKYQSDQGGGEPTHVELSWRSIRGDANEALVPDGMRLVYEGSGTSCLYIRIDGYHLYPDMTVLTQYSSNGVTYENGGSGGYIPSLPSGTTWIASGDWNFPDVLSVQQSILRDGESWSTVSTFYNGWGAYNTSNYPVRYRKLPDGRVELEGLIAGGSIGAKGLVLPAGYRPGKQQFRSCVCSDWGHASVDAHTNGDITVRSASSTTWVDLSGIHFYAG